MTELSAPLHSYLGLGTLIDISSEEWLADDSESEEAWLTSSKAERLLSPTTQQQAVDSQRSSSGQRHTAPEECDGSQNSFWAPIPHQEHGSPQDQHQRASQSIMLGLTAQEAVARSSGCGDPRCASSSSTSPASPLSANMPSAGSKPGSPHSRAGSSTQELGRLSMSSIAQSSRRRSHGQHMDYASSRRQSWAAPASGSNSSDSSPCRDAETLDMNPYTVRHLCLQELELLWSEDCSERQDRIGSSHRTSNGKAEDQAHDLVRSLQIASLLEKLRSAVEKVDEQLEATMAQMQESALPQTVSSREETV